MECPDCGSEMVQRKGPYGHFYGCNTYPECRGVISCDKSGKLTSIPGDAATRNARKEAHKIFDQLWKNGLMSRTKAYRWLRRAMDLKAKDAHISQFDKKQCELVIEYVKLELGDQID
jgi:ssDNA-binding Zn-finger/Zn-ribbon topoisomerase 1